MIMQTSYNCLNKMISLMIMRKSIVEEWRDIPKSGISDIADCCKKHQMMKGVKITGIQAYGYKWRYK